MKDDLDRALMKPAEERSWVMVIDLRTCVGCSACTAACISENKLPPGVYYRVVMESETQKYPDVKRTFTPRPCMHCDKPTCRDVCPVNAISKKEDGIVVFEYDKCIGCSYCVWACPYNAASFDYGKYYTEKTPSIQPYETLQTFEYDISRKRKKNEPPMGRARKCHFCMHRINSGMLPACTTTCISRATYFGDQNDPESLVSKLIKSPRAMRLMEERGTEPRVYYLNKEE